MAYGYYNPSNSSTGQSVTSDGETFIQRQLRLQQQGQPQSQPQTARPSSTNPTGGADGGGFIPPAGTQQGTPQSSYPAGTGTPVAGNGSIPPPQGLAANLKQQAGGVSQAPPAAPAAAPAAPAAPVRTNFRWGNGINTSSGYDPNAQNGNTNSWTEADWQRYEKANNIQPSGGSTAPAASAPTTMSLADREKAIGIEDRGNNLVYVPSYGGLVDRNHPIYIEAMKAAPTTVTGPVSGPIGKTAQAGSLNGSEYQTPAEASKSGMFSQFQSPDHDFTNWQQLQLVNQILANPDTLNPHVIDQLQQRSQEEAMDMAKQLQDQQQSDLVDRGFSMSGGTADAQKRATNENLTNAILGKRRDIEIQAAQQNRQDETNALAAAEGILQGQTGRAGQVYGNVLQGQQANRDDYYRGKGLDLQEKLGVGGLGIDQQRVTNQSNQFDKSNALNILQYLEGMRQSDNSNGLGWAQLNQQGQNSTIDKILQALR
jgi:hypothetical protein